MDCCSEDDLEISEIELDNYSDKIYEQLKNGKHEVQNADFSFRCPFCIGLKKQDYLYNEILQHATAVGVSPSSKRQAKEKGRHLALAMYLKNDIFVAKGPSKPELGVEPSIKSDYDDRFVWPWMGVLVNLPTEWKDGRQVGENPSKLKEQLSKFHPVKILELWTFHGPTGNAIVDFTKDCNGFQDAMAFEVSLESDRLGRNDWNERKNIGSNIYGWVARAEDYYSMGPIGDHLRKNGHLKTIPDSQKDRSRRKEKLVQNLVNEVGITNMHLKDESEISEAEFCNFKFTIYEQLKSGKHKVQNSDFSFRCPFCMGKKKNDYHYNEILQHASGVGVSPSSNRKADEKGKHLALAMYLENDIRVDKGPSKPGLSVKPSTKTDSDYQFVWPWMGVLVNLPTEWKDGKLVGGIPSMLKTQLLKFHPVKINALWTFHGDTGAGIVDFTKHWKGFKDAMAFEMSLESYHFGRKDWNEGKSIESNVYGWVARAEDYNSMGPIGDHLRKNGDLINISDFKIDELRRNENLNQNLANEIDVKNECLKDLEFKYNETNSSLSRMIEEKDKLRQSFNDEMRKMQCIARYHYQQICQENEMLKDRLENQQKELEWRSRELDKRHTQDGNDERKLLDEKRKADQNVFQLFEDQKVPKMMKELEEKESEMGDMEALNQALIVKERKSNDELQDARKELISGLKEIQTGRTLIGIKRMGELDDKPFKAAYAERFSDEEADLKGAELCSFWEECIKNPEWQPFKIVTRGDRVEEIVNENDEKLKGLRSDWGVEVFMAVATALRELNEYNPSGRYAIPELWNFEEGRKATLKEVLQYVMKQWNTHKRQRQ